MAKMYGKRGIEHWHSPDFIIPKSKLRNEEEIQWRTDAEQESLKHQGGLCPYSIHGCIECWDIDHDDAYDNSDLDEIPGVWSDHDWRKYLTEADYWFMERMDERITDARKRREIEQAWEDHTQNRDSGTGSVRAAG